MNKKLILAIALVLILGGGLSVWKQSRLAVNDLINKPVAADTYIVWSATKETTVNRDEAYTCDATAYRYALGARKMLALTEREAINAFCDNPFGLDTVDGYVYFGDEMAVNFNGRDITSETELNVKRGVEGFGTGALRVLAEYMVAENDTIVTFSPSEGENTQITFQNEKYISLPYYLSPINVSDDGTQVYFGEFTEASGSLRSGIHLWVYDVAKKTMNKVLYGKDLLVNAFTIDPTSKRLLVVSGTFKVNEEAPGWDEVAGPSQLHLVDLVTGAGHKLGVETTDEELILDPKFSPIDLNTFAYGMSGATDITTVDTEGLVTESLALEGQIAEWKKDLLVITGRTGWDMFDAMGKTKLGSTPFADFDLSNGAFGFQYLGSVTTPSL